MEATTWTSHQVIHNSTVDFNLRLFQRVARLTWAAHSCLVNGASREGSKDPLRRCADAGSPY